MASSCTNTDVILNSCEINPSCAHGPTLLFERYVKGGGCKKFFACSAFRDRKQCNFFLWANKSNHKNIADTIVTNADSALGRGKPNVYTYSDSAGENCSFNHSLYRKRFFKFKKLLRSERSVCCTCGLLLLPGELTVHQEKGHTVKQQVGLVSLRHPTALFVPKEDNKTFAQYMFSEPTVQFLLSVLESLKFSHVLSIGVPRIHEAICVNKKTGENILTSLLLDLDVRYAQVYSHNKLCLYNMFNHHFLDSLGNTVFESFLLDGGTRLVLVTDPPFGGMVEPLVATFKKIEQSWQARTGTDQSLPIIWFFPYFMEKRIKEAMPSLSMLDYKVDYDNHSLFKTKDGKKGSPVRIFTNVPASSIPLPVAEGYWFCELCQRYSAKENKHCYKCRSCTSKDGTTYIHCDLCNRCVKPSRVHCKTCNLCDQPSHKCGENQKEGCFICGDLNHKRRECPQKSHNLHQRVMKRKAKSQRCKANKKTKKYLVK